jgi:hypothetical protein
MLFKALWHERDGDAVEDATVGGRSGIASLLLFAVLLPATAAFGILYRQALSVPYQDDYNAILAFAADYEQLPTLRSKVLDIATARHNEYKLGFEHFIVASELEFHHHLNFAFLTALGDLLLLPIAYLLWLTYGDEESGLDRRLIAFLPISLCFFSLTYWENLNWAMTGLQNTPVILFSFLAIYLVARRKIPPRAHLLLGCLSAALAAFSSANGFLLGPLGLLIFMQRRAYAASVAWCAGFVVPLAAYLYHYTPSAYLMHRFFFLTRPLFFLGFLGGVVPFPRLAVLLGLGVLAVILLAVRSRFDRINPAAFYFTLWILASGCLAAWVRGAGTYAIASRYSIYSCLLLIFCYSFLAQYLHRRSPAFNRKRFYVTAIIIAAGLGSASNVHAYISLGERRRMVLLGIELYRARPEVNSPMNDPRIEIIAPREKAYEQDVLTEAIQKRIYTLPPKQQTRQEDEVRSP